MAGVENAARFAMSVADLTSNYLPVYPEEATWEATMQLMRDDEVEDDIVESLMAEYRRDGGFREPITIQNDDPEDPELIHMERGTKGYVINGTHRLCALLRLEATHAEVAYPKWEEWDYDEPYTALETVIQFDTPCDDEMFDDLHYALRSLRISDDLWLTSSISSQGETYFLVTWDVEHDGGRDYDPQESELIEVRIVQRLLEHGIEGGYSISTSWNRYDPATLD
jgi:hypothetical protein